jgi:DnaK suppressor protein
MARKDALLRLHNRLVAKRDALRSKLGDELNLGSGSSVSGPGDIGDEAYEANRTEFDSRLASLESRELNMVERALAAMRAGRYGKCEVCTKAIPVTRLQALPFATFCVGCQREAEKSDYFDPDGDANWEAAFLYEGRSSDRELTMQDIDID